MQNRLFTTPGRAVSHRETGRPATGGGPTAWPGGMTGQEIFTKRCRAGKRGDGGAYPLHSSMARSCASSTSMRPMAKPALRASSMGRVYRYCISMGRPRSQSTFMLGE